MAGLVVAGCGLIGAALPAAAQDYDKSRLAGECRANQSKATCDCVISRLVTNPDGRFAMDAYEIPSIGSPESERAVRSLYQRYGLPLGRADAAMTRAQSAFSRVMRECR